MLKFSVIIPNYNHAQFLVERIESILSQSYPHFEVIILDDASTDNSREIIEQYRLHPKIKTIFYNDTNSGRPTLQWLKGIEQASHEYIWIAESDDIAEVDFLETAAIALSGKDNILFYTDSFEMTDSEMNKEHIKYSAIKNRFFNTNRWQKNYLVKGTVEIELFMKYVCTINNVSSCIVPKKETLEILTHFPHIIYNNDWFFYLQLAERCDIVYNAACLNWYRSHKESHVNAGGNEIAKKKECFNILCYLYKIPYITSKGKIVKFFTEQYLAFGLWKESKFMIPLFTYFIRQQPVLFMLFFWHLIKLKVTRKKIKYIF